MTLDTDTSAALDRVAAWCSAMEATPRRPPIGEVSAALDRARASHDPDTIAALARALVRWCETASARADAADMGEAMFGAVSCAAGLDAVARRIRAATTGSSTSWASTSWRC